MFMLTQERYAAILNMLKEKNTVTLAELVENMEASESTIRRDLASLDEMGRLKRIRGGAASIGKDFVFDEDDVNTKFGKNVEEKQKIAMYAAGLIQDEDCIFIDAGTTTEMMIDYIQATKAVFVTNGIRHAQKLIKKGLRTYMIGGRIKPVTEAVIGAEGVQEMMKYNFTKCFLGTNGIHLENGFTTVDPEEAMMKKKAVEKSYVTCILADHTKFGKVTPVTFADIKTACIITDREPDKRYCEITVVKALG
jgi:DeoR family fructose operon transcriptional repressor